MSFKLTDFTSKKAGNVRYKSPAFFSHLNGYTMCLLVKPNGDRAGRNTHISVYISLMQGPNDDNLEWPFRGVLFIHSVLKFHSICMVPCICELV